ncbi:hypothetical protein RvY_09812 [Ramazzottius varieornatus]|uniref:Uncharacterized protein n=1 Tax=Ramazzottius varieornatus TaxID=947166 RepID=A0A1D1VJM3_RAMVA|nr:hypothetical protein RvY_09812 [Ramazzottius varieornatus]
MAWNYEKLKSESYERHIFFLAIPRQQKQGKSRLGVHSNRLKITGKLLMAAISQAKAALVLHKQRIVHHEEIAERVRNLAI